MLLSSVIIILREVLEASLLISVLLVLSRHYHLRPRWLGASLITGVILSFLYMQNVTLISDQLDGVGLEILNGTIQFLIYFLLLLFIWLLLRQPSTSTSLIPYLMSFIVILAITREGFEIVVYLNNFISMPEQFVSVLTGAVIGTSIGLSIGILLYFLLYQIALQRSVMIGLFLLIFIAAGMVSQAIQLYIQADWLPSQLPLWDTSSILDEQTVIGQLLYAVMGYEATPTPIMVTGYLSALLLAITLLVLSKNSGLSDDDSN